MTKNTSAFSKPNIEACYLAQGVKKEILGGWELRISISPVIHVVYDQLYLSCKA